MPPLLIPTLPPSTAGLLARLLPDVPNESAAAPPLHRRQLLLLCTAASLTCTCAAHLLCSRGWGHSIFEIGGKPWTLFIAAWALEYEPTACDRLPRQTGFCVRAVLGWI